MPTLRDEILSGPLSAELAPFVASRHDAAIAAVLNDLRYATVGPVSRAVFSVWSAAGPRAAIEDHAGNPESALRSSALALRDFLTGQSPALDLADPSVAALLAAWVAAGAITPEQHASLLGLGARTISRAEQAGFGQLHHSAVSAALNGA